jgi:hypothetical protein
MMPPSGEEKLYQAVLRAIADWLAKVRDAIMGAFNRFKLLPDPLGAYNANAAWVSSVDNVILPQLRGIAGHAWDKVTEIPYPSTNAHVAASLASTRNLLVRMPDEVYHLIFATLSDSQNAGLSVQATAAKVDKVLSVTDSERWPNRARVIAQTELLRASNIGTLAAGFEMQNRAGTPMVKEWVAADDERTRIEHREADGQQRLLGDPFNVGGYPMMAPGDVLAPPELVINCRCSMLIADQE